MRKQLSANIAGNAETVTGLSVTSKKTLAATNTITLSGTDSSTLNIGTGGTLGTAAFTDATAYAPAFVSGTAKYFWATPNGAAGVPSLRAIVASDIPALAYDAAGAAAAITIDSIADADTTHAPSRNAVFDALALKAPVESTGSWTPVRNSFTEVMGGGSITNTGTYVKAGSLVFLYCELACAGGATLACTAGGVSNITGLPFTPGKDAAGRWFNATTSIANGGMQTGGATFYFNDGWAAASNTWKMTVTFHV